MLREPHEIATWIARLMRSLENGLLAGLLTAMIVFAVMQIVLRNVFDSGIAWVDPLLRLLVLWVGMAGAMVATRRDKHIAVDVVTRHLPPNTRLTVRVVVDLFSASVAATIAYHAVRFVWMEREAETIALAAVPAWLCELIIPVAFSVIALRYFFYMLSHGRQLIGNLLI